MESLFGLATVQWNHEPRVESKPSRRGRTPRSAGSEAVRIPLNRPPGTFSLSGGEGWDEGVRFMERLPNRDWVPAAPDCEICPAHLSARRPVPAPEQGELRSRRPRRPNPEPGRFGGIQAFSA